ncbi:MULTISPECIES: lipid A biosynthesis lauroyl acyltransferase [unclassified Aureimonas]|uniref:lipid A biosynthesis lauroyl acyltransferase n=1 Tax=unclassified Aureimonas TaxID=2615206 RepID=UPI0006F6F75E|nr:MULTISPECIES: lipid A biosynthesis lauroyl acyltransferase [unclassified Aureimonas]KQT57319.1 lipid A biosynthesis lauroyl acyltransferase [Aureimonas sp. Leaf427]KQT76999.1 lipid A biosynthesis lauroyl acyltransferase [Aureimonas sp. Leaf460]
MNLRYAKAWKRWRKASDFVVAQTLFLLLRLLRLFPARAGLSIAAAVGRTLGPLTPRHKLAIENLRLAYPEKDAAWIDATARANWEQMSRLAAEYVYLDEIFDFDPERPDAGIVEVEGAEIFAELRERKGPFVFFTGHLGCFELLPICAATFGLEVTALFRQPNNRYIAREILATRRTSGGHLVPSKAGAAWALVGTLERGGAVGMLVDQKFKKGVATTFFGRPCRTNPLLPKLARQFDCEIYPARSIRLPNGRYRLELKPRLELPRDAAGAIDVAASCQMLNDVVEGWVREHPEQWMWFHRRWQM